MRVEGEYGKTEAWYILDCDEGAELILGFNREVSVEEFKKAAQSESGQRDLHRLQHRSRCAERSRGTRKITKQDEFSAHVELAK